MLPGSSSRWLGLEAAKEEYEQALAGAFAWFRRATAANGRTGYMAPGDDGSRLARAHPEPYPFSKELPVMTAAAIACRVHAGEDRSVKGIERSVDLVLRHLPLWREAMKDPVSDITSTINYQYWHYGTIALARIGGEPWSAWKQEVIKILMAAQSKDEVERGSWDPVDEWGPVGGRVYSTALAVATLAAGGGR